MKKYINVIGLLLFSLCVGLTGLAQDQPGTVKFPGGIDTPDSLFRVSDKANSTLASSITTASTSITLTNAGLFPSSGSAIIDYLSTPEIIYYTGKSGNVLTGVTRGASSTVPMFHSAGANVRGVVLAVHHNTLAASIITIQTKLGSGASVPAAGKFPKGTGPGTSQWGDILITDVAGLQAALDSKAASVHTHTVSQITNAGTAASKNAPASGNAAAGEVVLGSDTRLNDARTPTTHTHNLSQVTDAGTAALRNVAMSGNASSSEVVKGDDTRLIDARTPTVHTHSESDITNLASDLAAKQPLDPDLTTIAGLSPVANDVMQFKSGAWINRSIAQLKADFAFLISDVAGLQAALNLKANLISSVFTGHSGFGSSGSIDPNGNPAVISLYEVFTSPLLLKNGIYSRIDVRPTSNSTTQHAAFYGETLSISGDTSNIGTMLGAFGRVEHAAVTTLATGTGLLSNVLNTGAGTITSGRGVSGVIQNSSTGTIATAIGAAGQTNNISTGTITEARGISGAVSNTGNGTYTTAYGAKVTFVNTGTASKIVTGYGFYSTAITQSGGASIDNLYGAYLSDWSSYSANSYNFYSAGATARNYIEGKLGVGVTINDAAAKVQIDSTTQGFLPPRMTMTQRDAISAPPRGLQIYNTTTDQMNYYNGTSWVAF